MQAALGLFMLDRYEIGMTVRFGAYEQDGDLTNGSEDIEWRILDIVDGKALLLSVNALELVPYNPTALNNLYWEDSKVCDWLATELYDKAFASYEKYSITTMPTAATSFSETDETLSDYTEAYVSVLSVWQIEKYMPEPGMRICSGSRYAASKAGTVQNGALWYTRMPGEFSRYGRFVMGNGETTLAHEGIRSILVRPCVWVDLG